MNQYTYRNYLFLLYYAKFFAVIGLVTTTILVGFVVFDLFSKQWGYPWFTLALLLPAYLLFAGFWILGSYFIRVLKNRHGKGQGK